MSSKKEVNSRLERILKLIQNNPTTLFSSKDIIASVPGTTYNVLYRSELSEFRWYVNNRMYIGTEEALNTYLKGKESKAPESGTSTEEDQQEPLTNKEMYLKKRLVEVEREISNMRTQQGGRELAMEAVLEAVEKFKPYFNDYKAPAIIVPKTPMEAVSHLCDWQIGQIIDKHMTNHWGVFNYNIACDRMFYWANEHVKWLERMRQGYKIPNGTVVILGDMIEGELRHESTATNEFPVPEQQVRCSNLLGEVIHRIAHPYERLTIRYVVPDNHSRRTKKYQFKEAGLNSDNYMVAALTKALCSGLPNVEFNIHLELQAWFEINGVPFIAEHGHGVRNTLGHPWYAMAHKMGREALKVMTTSVKKAQEMESESGGKISWYVEKPFHKVLIGHFHVPMITQWYMVGGCLPGTSELDSSFGRHAAPSQPMFLLHPKHHIVN